MQTALDIIQFVERQPEMMRVLALVEDLSLPDCWIGAGFLRNAVWDALSGKQVALSDDVDVVYFDPANPTAAHEALHANALGSARPDIVWDVKNQARMHVRNGDPAYLNCEDAIGRWPETATAVAVRKISHRVEICAPLGIADLLGFVVRPTPAFASRRGEVARRVDAKSWRLRWPRLTVLS